MIRLKNFILKRIRNNFNKPLDNEKNVLMLGLMLAKANRDKKKLSSLSEAEWSGFSQWGEDGIIDWLIEMLPAIPKTFIEFGVENYKESNTRMLLHLRNWRGLVLDGSNEHVQDIRQQKIYWRYDLTANSAFIDKDNINGLISDVGLSGDIGLLSIDIDGNDYWVWKAIDVVKPVIVICEYNAVFGDIHKLSVPYDKNFRRTSAHHSNLYFGASLPALISLGEEKGYKFIGSTSTGLNAFFVRNDYAQELVNNIDEIKAYPSVFREARDENGSLIFSRGMKRADHINKLPLVDVTTQHTITLAECNEIYSASWKEILEK